MAGGLSIHCVDIAHGRVAVGLPVTLLRSNGTVLASGTVGAQGLFEHPVLMGPDLSAGSYEVVFGVGDFYRAMGTHLPNPPFLDLVPYRFQIADASQHVHLPFKFTPWGFSLFKGGA